MNPPLPLLSLSYRSKLSAIVLLLPVKFEVRQFEVEFECDVAGEGRNATSHFDLRPLFIRAPAVIQEPVNRRAGGVNGSENAVDAR